MLEATSGSKASVILCQAVQGSASTEVMHSVPMLIADFEDLPEPNSPTTQKAGFDVRLGMTGCPSATAQVIFFTDDGSYIESEDTYEEDLCVLVRDTPVGGVLWAPEGAWNAEGDHRLFAVGVLAGGGCYSVAGTLCEAIKNRYLFSPSGAIPALVSAALKALKDNDGSDLTPKLSGASPQLRNRKSGNKRSK